MHKLIERIVDGFFDNIIVIIVVPTVVLLIMGILPYMSKGDEIRLKMKEAERAKCCCCSEACKNK